MIIVTGGAGFIGSNLIERLNMRGATDILVVDDLTDGHKMRNLADLSIADYVDQADFLNRVKSGEDFGEVDCVFHLGACSSTTEWDGRYLMRNNYEYSKILAHHCVNRSCAFIYASSASVYGLGVNGFSEDRACEHPINMYAYSKHLFDEYVRKNLSGSDSQIVGLRYFNVYGPREQHKDGMASPVFHFNRQLKEGGTTKLFCGSDGYGDGEQMRDFIYVDDCSKVNCWFMENPDKSGIFNCGTGAARTFNDMARAVIAWHGAGTIEYVPFPDKLKGAYQSYTQADISALRSAGYTDEFTLLEDGVWRYLDKIEQS